jgi:deoxyhypusine synthase
MTKLTDPLSDFLYVKGSTASDILNRMGSVGYQASSLRRAAEIIEDMKAADAKIFLAFTSNMASSGLRGLFAQMIEKGLAHTVVTTVGSIEEDFIKARNGKFYIGSFEENDAKLGSENINRIGNILVPSKSYSDFEHEMKSALDKIIKPDSTITPSELITALGPYCKDEHSIIHQAYKKGVNIYCPALTDGSFGFQLQELRNTRNFQIDIVKDMKNLVLEADIGRPIGVIALGGGVAKHHAILANIVNGGADYAVYVTTAHQHSGSLSGATTEEAKSWGKVKPEAEAVTVNAEASISVPLMISKVFEDLDL